jgi:opacity protein-like surface antigen
VGNPRTDLANLWDNWTAKVEYNMLDFGNDFVTDNAVHVVKAGVNYRFRL